MLGIKDLVEQIRMVSYKPGWMFYVYETPAQGIWVKITFEASDSTDPNPDAKSLFVVKSPVPTIARDCSINFLEWLRWRLEVIELHECHEFFKYDGMTLWNPHAEEATEPY